jgi:hypothetical protein
MWIKLIDFSQRILEEGVGGTGLRIFPSVYMDSSSERFYELDRELFPKIIPDKSLISGRYSQIPVIGIKALEDDELMRRIQSRIDKTRGGYHAILDLSSITELKTTEDVIDRALSKLNVVKIRKNLVSCSTCNTKSPPVSRCPKCGSASILSLQTDN